jgi:hypothetical protein
MLQEISGEIAGIETNAAKRCVFFFHRKTNNSIVGVDVEFVFGVRMRKCFDDDDITVGLSLCRPSSESSA